MYILKDKLCSFVLSRQRNKYLCFSNLADPVLELEKKQNLKVRSNIELVIGDCGSGKSCYVALRARKWLKKGYNVFSNMHIEGCFQFDLTDLLTYDFKIDNKPYVIIIDEASAFGLGSRGELHKNNNKQNIIEFFTQYRHYKSHMVYVVAPSFQDILPVVRSRCDTLVVVKRTLFKMFGMLKFRKIYKEIDIVGNHDVGSEPKEVYYWGMFTTRYKFKFLAYKMFDTYACKVLKVKNFKKW